MTLTDLISKRGISHPMESFSQQTQKKRPKLNRSNKFHQNGKFKKLQTSVLDLLHVHHPMDNLENKDIHHQQQESLPPHPSIIKSSDIARVLSKKSVTFASVFDPGENKDDVIWNFEPITEKEMDFEEDLVTVIPHNPINDQITIDTNETIEPYPFRSEIPVPLTSLPNSSVDGNTTTTTTSHRSRKKIIHHFTPHHRPKKLRHPIQIIDPVITRTQSTSTPNLALSSSISPHPTRTAQISTNEQQRPLKTDPRTWFKLSSIAQFIRSFGTHSHQKQKNDTAKTKTNPSRRSTGLRPTSELLY